MKEKINGPEQLKIVATKEDFIRRLDDAQNQFIPITWDLRRNLTLEDLIEKNKKYPYLSFRDYIKTVGYQLSTSIDIDKYSNELINSYEGLLQRIKSFQSIQEAQDVLKELDLLVKSTSNEK